jgi:sec-independent protein translocase protein TatA
MFAPIANLLEPGIGPLLIILALALLFFGHKLPQLARGLGASVNEFKKGFKDGEEGGETPPEAEAKKDVTPEKK